MNKSIAEKKIISFWGDAAIKEKYIARMKAHMAADELVQGTGWEKNGIIRGCAVGCTLDAYDHLAYETELGIPRILAHLEDRIFEGLSVEDSKGFPLSFLEAIPIGRDLSNVYKRFFIWILTDAEYGVIKLANTEQTKMAIQNVSDLLSKSLLREVNADEYIIVWKAACKARNAAYAAAAAAYAYAAYATAAAADAAAAAADAYAADAYAYAYAAYAYATAAAAAAAYATAADAYAYAAAYAAYAYAADAAAAAADADAARRRYYKKMADKLVDLLKDVE